MFIQLIFSDQSFSYSPSPLLLNIPSVSRPKWLPNIILINHLLHVQPTFHLLPFWLVLRSWIGKVSQGGWYEAGCMRRKGALNGNCWLDCQQPLPPPTSGLVRILSLYGGGDHASMTRIWNCWCYKEETCLPEKDKCYSSLKLHHTQPLCRTV